MPRPSAATGDNAYYRYVVVVCGLMFLLAVVHFASKPGRAWAAIRESEPAALAAGVNITRYKLWAFALASFMTGVAGCLLAAQIGQPNTYAFPTQDSLSLIATALIGGIFTLWGALVAGIFLQLLPFVFQAEWHINPQLPADHLRHRPAAGAADRAGWACRPGAEGPGEARAGDRRSLQEGHEQGQGTDVIEVKGLTVRFSGVTPIDDMSVTFPGGACGLIGPNGAGKTTFFNVLSGFVKPSAGSIQAFGEDLLKLVDFRRARWGLRRTFQTQQAIEQLSVFDNVAMIHEHSGAGRGGRREAVMTAIEFVGLETPPTTKVGGLGARERRLVEVARAVVGEPRVVLLDEPAAGLPDEETRHLADVIQRIPPQFGALVILVDHDMSLVSACCETTAVLDFGKLIASGPTAEVLRNEHVINAYLGHRGRAVSATDGAKLMLRLDGLSVPRAGRDVVHEVSLEIPPGEVTTLLGANGAGKSTLVLAVAGVLRPSAGRVLLGERDLTTTLAGEDPRRRASRSSRRAGGFCRR